MFKCTVNGSYTKGYQQSNQAIFISFTNNSQFVLTQNKYLNFPLLVACTNERSIKK